MRNEFEQVRYVYSGEYLDDMRKRMRRRYRRRLWWKRFKDATYQGAVYLGTFVSATILAVAWLATIAILCGY